MPVNSVLFFPAISSGMELVTRIQIVLFTSKFGNIDYILYVLLFILYTEDLFSTLYYPLKATEGGGAEEVRIY